MHPFMQMLWGHIGKYTVEKYQTNASFNPSALRTHLKTNSEEKSNNCNQSDYASTHLKMHCGEMQPMWSCIHTDRQFEEAYENMHVTMPPRMHILKSWMIEFFLPNYSQFVFAMLPVGIGHFIYFVKSLQSLQYWFLHLSNWSVLVKQLHCVHLHQREAKDESSDF